MPWVIFSVLLVAVILGIIGYWLGVLHHRRRLEAKDVWYANEALYPHHYHFKWWTPLTWDEFNEKVEAIYGAEAADEQMCQDVRRDTFSFTFDTGIL